jgi:hypothetical protein
MKLEQHILTECYIDTLLVKTLSPPKERYNHQKSCNNVLKTMREDFADRAALGIIDDDKTVRKFDDFSLLKKHNEQLSIYKHREKPHYIVKIGKAAEDFILKNAEKCKINLSEYGLPSDLEGLKKRTKQINSLQDIELKRLFSDLTQNENSDLCKLAQWIEFFKKQPYNINKYDI